MPQHTPARDEDRTRDLLHVASAALREAESHLESLDSILLKNLNAYLNEPEGLPAIQPGQSDFVFPLVQQNVRRLARSARRVLVDRGVSFMPSAEGEADAARQAGEYVSEVVCKQPGFESELLEGVRTAAALGMGATKVETQFDEAEEDGGDIYDESMQAPRKPRVVVRNITRGNLLTYPGTLNLQESPFVAERLVVTRAELLAHGMPSEVALGLATASGRESAARKGGSSEHLVLSRQWESTVESTTEATKDVRLGELVELFDCYVRYGDDGQLYHLLLGERGEGDYLRDYEESEGRILLNEPVTAPRVPIVRLVIESVSGMLEGRSLSEILAPMMVALTILSRAVLDNARDVGTPQAAVNVQALMEGELEKIKSNRRAWLFLRGGLSASDAVQFSETPFVGDKLQAVMAQWDRIAADASGIADASGGLTEESISQMSATQSAIIEADGAAQSEAYMRELAGGFREIYEEVLRQIVDAGVQDVVVRDGTATMYDASQWSPHWKASLDSSMVTGSRGTDAQAIMQLLQQGGQLMTTLGPENPIVGVAQMRSMWESLIDTLGFGDSHGFLAKMNDQEVDAWVKMQQQQAAQQAQQAQQQAAQIEQVKAETQIMIARGKADVEARTAEKKAVIEAETERQRNAAQAQGDRIAAEAKMAADVRVKEMEQRFEARRAEIDSLVAARLEEFKAEVQATQELRVQDDEQRHEIELEKLKNQGRIDVEKAKPKPVAPKPSGGSK